MFRVGFILLDKKRPRVLTPALRASAQQHGVLLVALDPDTPAQWEAENVDVIVHKVPEDPGLDGRLLSFQQAHPQLVLLDPPAAVRQLQDREAMLQPLAGRQLVLTQPPACSSTFQQQQPAQCCTITTPPQATLPAGCSCEQAVQLMTAAGVSLPALVKPLRTAPPDSASASSPSSGGHELGAVLCAEGLAALVQGAEPALQLPVVLQQFVPHGQGLYKLYVIGPHVVLTRRSTLTLQQLEAAAAAAETDPAGSGSGSAGKQGLVLLQCVSAVPLPVPLQASSSVQQPEAAALGGTVGADVQQWRQELQQQARLIASPVDNAEQGSHAAGVALADSSVVGDAAAPPLWAMQQLAVHLRQQLQLNIFNVDIILAPGPLAGAAAASGSEGEAKVEHSMQHAGKQQQVVAGYSSSGSSSSSSSRCFLVVDINFFPGFDKVPGAEQLFADYLGSLSAVKTAIQ